MNLPHKAISYRAFSLWSFLIAIEGFIASYFLVKEPSEIEHVLAFGFSVERLLIVASVLVLALFFAIITVTQYYQLISWNDWINLRQKLIPYVLACSLILGIAILQVLFLFPGYQSPILFAYLSRLRPVLIWLALLFMQTVIFLAYFRGISFKWMKKLQNNRPVVISLVTISLVWGTIATTKLGITPDNLFWNMAGVPLLSGQIWLAIWITLISWILRNQIIARIKGSTTQLSFAIFIGIWIVTALIWVNTPLAPTFNAPGPYLPSKGFYPFVDAASYDLGAQSAIYGRGINFGAFIDRGLLMGFLALLHRLFGQNYLAIVGVQSAIFAVFPALLYLLGKKLYSQSAGLMVATLAVLKVKNAISGGNLISTSHPKLLLTEFSTGIVLVLFSLFLVKWLMRNRLNSYALISLGASIGIGILLRQNVFFMVPVFLLLGIVWVWKQNWKRAFRDVLLVGVAFFITISPWMWRNQRVAGEPLFFLPHFNRVIEERYQPQSSLYKNRVISPPASRALRVNGIMPRAEKNGVFDQYQFIPNHFAHNIITSVLILPPSPVLDNLRHVVDNYPYWGRMTNYSPGQISGFMGIFLAINLFLLAIGFGAVWKRVGFVAIVPLAVFLFYNLANAFARTSGGRYIVPVDWVVYFYYAIGLVEIIRFCISKIGFQTNDFWGGEFDNKHDEIRKLSWSKAGLVILPFFLIVASLPLIELASPGAKPPQTTGALLQQMNKASFSETSGLSQPEVEEFLANPDAILISGRGFYPRYYSHDEGEPILPGLITPYTPREFPRLVFTLLLPDKDKSVVLPLDKPRLKFPDAAQVIVGGCQVIQNPNDPLSSYLNYIDAAFVVILDKPGEIYIRDPKAPLTCPLRVPVCDNNHNCK